MSDEDARSLKAAKAAEVDAPALPWRPPSPQGPIPGIALIGCGGISDIHLQAYRKMGWDVLMLCDPDQEAADKRRKEHFPEAEVTTSLEDVLANDAVQVVDIATHVNVRPDLVRQSLEAGRHVLSQKPFVTDLAEGRALVELADAQGVQLAVNQNGRWAPYFSWLRQAVHAGLLGDIRSVDLQVAWDHTWIAGTAFERMRHILLYDFAIHWFDIVAAVYAGRTPQSVYARVAPVVGQSLRPAMSAQALVEYEGGQAALTFRAHNAFDQGESCLVTGTKGTFRSRGAVCANDQVTFTTEAGTATVPLDGNWFPDGFAGSMGELLCAIEAGRAPENSARTNLDSLALCFAAVQSADQGIPVKPGAATTPGAVNFDDAD